MMIQSMIGSLKEYQIGILNERFDDLMKDIKSGSTAQETHRILNSIKNREPVPPSNNKAVQDAIQELSLFMTNPSETLFVKGDKNREGVNRDWKLSQDQISKIPDLLSINIDAFIETLNREIELEQRLERKAAENEQLQQKLAAARVALENERGEEKIFQRQFPTILQKQISVFKFKTCKDDVEIATAMLNDDTNAARFTPQQIFELAKLHQRVRTLLVNKAELLNKLTKVNLIQLGASDYTVAECLVNDALRDGQGFGFTLYELKDLILDKHFRYYFQAIGFYYSERFLEIGIRLLEEHLDQLQTIEWQRLLAHRDVARAFITNNKDQRLYNICDQVLSFAIIYAGIATMERSFIITLLSDPMIIPKLSFECVLSIAQANDKLLDLALGNLLPHMSDSDKLKFIKQMRLTAMRLTARQKESIILTLHAPDYLSFSDFEIYFASIPKGERIKLLFTTQIEKRLAHHRCLESAFDLGVLDDYLSKYFSISNRACSTLVNFLQSNCSRLNDNQIGRILIHIVQDRAASPYDLQGLMTSNQSCALFLLQNVQVKTLREKLVNFDNCLAVVCDRYSPVKDYVATRNDLSQTLQKGQQSISSLTQNTPALASTTSTTVASRSGMFPEYDYLFKFKLYGDAGVGKSCLLLRYTDDTYTESCIPTIGVDFKTKTINIDGKIVKLQIWDTDGRERFGTIRSAYEISAQGVLLVFDVTDQVSFNNLKSWIKESNRVCCENFSTIIVGNKSDLGIKRVVDYNVAKAFADSFYMQYFETSAKQSSYVNDAFENLTREVLNRMIPVHYYHHTTTTHAESATDKSSCAIQ